MNSWKAFSASCWLWKHFPCKKVVKMLKEVVVNCWEVRWIWQMRQNFVAQFVQLLKCWLCYVWLGVVMQKNWVHSIHQCQLQALQFLVHLTNLQSILLRCNGFAWIQKAVGGSSRQITKQWPWPFLGASLALKNALELLLGPATELVIADFHIKSNFHYMSQSNQETVHCCYQE